MNCRRPNDAAYIRQRAVGLSGMFVIFRLLLNNHFGKLAPFGLDRRRNCVRRFKGLLSRLIPLDLKQFRLSELHPISKTITIGN